MHAMQEKQLSELDPQSNVNLDGCTTFEGIIEDVAIYEQGSIALFPVLTSHADTARVICISCC